MSKKIFQFIGTFLALLGLSCLVSGPAFALTPDNLLLLYNRNSAGSREVAEYYASKRGVPPINIIGVDLPDKERISRKVYEEKLVPPVYNALVNLKRVGRQPALLLVHGMPLVVGRQAGSGRYKQQRMIEDKALELASLVATLTHRLEMLTSEHPFHEPAVKTVKEFSRVPRVLEKAREVLRGVISYKDKVKERSVLSLAVPEIESIMYRLVGMSQVARKLQYNNKGSKLDMVYKVESMLKLSAVMESQLAKLPFYGATEENLPNLASLVRISQGLMGELKFWYDLREVDLTEQSSASLDSELSLVLCEPYLKAKWLPNPFVKQYDKVVGVNIIRSNTVKVARLDGPTARQAKRLVDDALWTEENGLSGVFYIDARGLKRNKDGQKKDYAKFDRLLYRLYEMVKEKTSLKVVFDDRSEVFAPGSCPEAALYCGWYSLGEYVDAFEWQRGAVGFHIASREAATLREKGSEVWCKKMLEKGAAATLGPVQEPYLHSFPRPDEFFPLLLRGELSLIDVYYRSVPLLSWRQVLIGDPLYNPFQNHPVFNEGGGN